MDGFKAVENSTKFVNEIHDSAKDVAALTALVKKLKSDMASHGKLINEQVKQISEAKAMA